MSEVDTGFTIGEMTDIFAKGLTHTLENNQGVCVIYKGEKIILYKSGDVLNLMKLQSDKIENMDDGDLMRVDTEDEYELNMVKN